MLQSQLFRDRYDSVGKLRDERVGCGEVIGKLIHLVHGFESS